MDNTLGAHVVVSWLVDRGDGVGHFEEATVPFDQTLGPLRQSAGIEASAIRFKARPGNCAGSFENSPVARVILIMEGAASVQCGHDRRDLSPVTCLN